MWFTILIGTYTFDISLCTTIFDYNRSLYPKDPLLNTHVSRYRFYIYVCFLVVSVYIGMCAVSYRNSIWYIYFYIYCFFHSSKFSALCWTLSLRWKFFLGIYTHLSIFRLNNIICVYLNVHHVLACKSAWI